MDIEYMLRQNKNQLWIWDAQKLSKNVNVSEDRSMSFGNKVYEPYYSLDGNYAMIQHETVKTFTSFYIFKKQDNDWVIVGSIKNIWW